jgi:hypothetical protein
MTGYYSNPQNSSQRMVFYDNGLVVCRIDDYNEERWKNNEPKNVSLFLKEVADNPYVRQKDTFADVVSSSERIDIFLFQT